jgi:hypothetical protein
MPHHARPMIAIHDGVLEGLRSSTNPECDEWSTCEFTFKGGYTLRQIARDFAIGRLEQANESRFYSLLCVYQISDRVSIDPNTGKPIIL